jgi:hypothetical protein
MFDIKCEYALRCSAYRNNSYTCKKAFDKRYCGIYRKLRGEATEIDIQNVNQCLECH